MHRRQFLQTSLAASAVLSTAPALRAQKNSPRKSKINVAMLGCGLRGQSHVDLMLRREDCVVTAIADIDPEMVKRTKAIFENQNRPLPTFYTNGPEGLPQSPGKGGP